MGAFQWNEHFVTGLGEVDKQHCHLVDVINQFGDLLTQRKGLAFGDFEKLFKELAAYAEYHFSEEESLMEEAGIDTRHLVRHRIQHASFLQEVMRMRAGITPDNTDEANPLLEFLTHWLAYHILGSDQSMARQLAAIQSGQAAADAYTREEHAKEADGAVKPLLNALNDLFLQLKQRNRELHQLNQTLESRVMDRTQAVLQANQELTELVGKLEAEREESRRLSKELAIANRQLEDMALTDVLTGLPNRRHAMQCLANAWAESVRDGTPLACLMIDVDNFKDINDGYGHHAGDEALRQLSAHLRQAVRTVDIVCRFGGDEFLIICPRTPMEGAMQIAERTRQAALALRLPVDSGEWRGSISVGVAVRHFHMSEPEDLIKMTDDGVYAAKRNGRNCIASSC